MGRLCLQWLLVGAVVACATRPPSEALNRDLLVAVESGNIYEGGRLIEAGASLETRNWQNRTPLQVAASTDDVEMASLLISRGADLAATDRFGNTALHVAAEAGQVDMVTFLLDKGARPDSINESGESPLHIAAGANDADSIRQMIIFGVNIDHRSTFGESALHIAIRKRRLFAAGALLAGGADVRLANAMGDTPLHLSMYAQQPELAQSLKKMGASDSEINAYGLSPVQFGSVPSIEEKVVELVAILKEDGDWSDRRAAYTMFEDLKKKSSRIVINALALQVLGTPDHRARTLILAVKLGIADSERKLGELLLLHGNRQMAEDYLNSGSTILQDWARRWASSKGYQIWTGAGSHRARWGSF